LWVWHASCLHGVKHRGYINLSSNEIMTGAGAPEPAIQAKELAVKPVDPKGVAR
jgi:hypothetical protein